MRVAVLPIGTKPESRASRKFRLLDIREFNVDRKASMLDSSRLSSSTPISRAILSPRSEEIAVLGPLLGLFPDVSSRSVPCPLVLREQCLEFFKRSCLRIHLVQSIRDVV